MFYVYVIRSLKTPVLLYVGFTDNLKQRLLIHNEGKSIFTSKHKPWKLETYFVFHDKQVALSFEKHLKTPSGKSFLSKRFGIKRGSTVSVEARRA